MTETSDPTGRALLRVTAADAFDAWTTGALLIDIRPTRLRSTSGEVAGALIVAGPLRDWRLGTGSPDRVCDLRDNRMVVVIGDGGAVSVLAVSALRGLGVTHVVDLAHGFPAWVEAGLPVYDGITLPGRYVPHQEPSRYAVPTSEPFAAA